MSPELEALKEKILRENPKAILFFKKKLISEMDWELCTRKDIELFKYAPNPTLEMCKLAVLEDGYNILYVPKRILDEDTEGLIDLAIINCPEVILELPDEYVNQRRKQLAVEHDAALAGDVGYLTPEYTIELLTKNPGAIKYIEDATEDEKCVALQSNPNVALYFKELTPKMARIIDEFWPEYKDILPNYPKI